MLKFVLYIIHKFPVKVSAWKCKSQNIEIKKKWRKYLTSASLLEFGDRRDPYIIQLGLVCNLFKNIILNK